MVDITELYTSEKQSSCNRNTRIAFFHELHDNQNYSSRKHANMVKMLYPRTFSSSVQSVECQFIRLKLLAFHLFDDSLKDIIRTIGGP
jgi:hypothetical protein